jgi:hypothetical protein
VTDPNKTEVVVIHFSLSQAHLPGENSFRLVVKPLEPLHVEVETKDRMGVSSWRPAKVWAEKVVAAVLSRALFKSQMTPLQRVENPRMLHPEGVVWECGVCNIYIGLVTP